MGMINFRTPNFRKVLNYTFNNVFTFSAAAGSSGVCTVTVTLKKANGDAVTNSPFFIVYLSDDAAGYGLTGTTASGAVAVTTGKEIAAITAQKAIIVQPDNTGKVVFTITDTAKTLFYIAAKTMDMLTSGVSSRLTTANYGA